MDSTCTLTLVELPGLIPPGRGVDRVPDTTWQRPDWDRSASASGRSTVQWRIAGGLGVGAAESSPSGVLPCPQVDPIAGELGRLQAVSKSGLTS